MNPSGLTIAQREEFLAHCIGGFGAGASLRRRQETAWEFFVETYRRYLRSATAAILRASALPLEARELADSLFAELYGLADGKTGERSLFRTFTDEVR